MTVSASLPRIVDAFSGPNVLVIGESILDSYLQGATSRLCPEAPVPVVDLSARLDQPGGATNSALNAHFLEANVLFLSVIGDDAEGEILLRSLHQQGVDPSHVLSQPGRRTLAKQRVFAGSQLPVRIDQGDTGPIARRPRSGLSTAWNRSGGVPTRRSCRITATVSSPPG